ncbi:amino acid adenylation domain-containing protein, partial [Lentzea sp. NPDC004789]
MGPEVLVGLCVERGVEMVVGLLGVLKAGGAYVPLDPEYPADRLGFVLADTGVSVVLTQQRLAGRLGAEAGREVVCLDRDWPVIEASAPVAAGESGVDSENVAYVIYTSGSTGRPKGVMIQHGGLANRLLWAQSEYLLDDSDVVLQKTPYSFDVSAWELFWPLIVGSRLVMMRPGEHRLPDRVAAAIDHFGVTTLHFVPSMLDEFVQAVRGGCESLRRVLVSGEALTGRTVQRFHETFDVELHNLYGPTEASIDVTSWRCEPGADRAVPIPIGRPVANMRVYVLDGWLQPIPAGVPGEVFLGGVGVGRGYLGRPGLTGARFVPDPFGEAGGRLYRTGDVGRFRADGVLEFLGRADEQVKIRGHRIEPGEIESVLTGLAEVGEAVVVARDDAMAGRRLVAYLVASGVGAAPNTSQLRTALLQVLPEYMVPSAFVWLPALPLTANGKLDRRGLPAPVERPELEVGFEPPVSATEQLLAGLWGELLEVDRVGVHDNFFELGGHSLLVMQLLWRLQEHYQVDLPVRTVFDAPTVAQLAAIVDGGEARAIAAIAPAPRGGDLPLSYAQQRLWFLHQLQPDDTSYVMQWVARLRGGLDVAALERAVGALVLRHEVLRTRLVVRAGRPSQVIDAPAPADVHLTDLSAMPADVRAAVASRELAEESGRGFDLEAGPVYRVRVIRLAGDEHLLMWTMHHVVGDGRSMNRLTKDLAALYRAEVTGEPADLPALPIQYADFAIWQREWLRGPATDDAMAYWSAQLAGAEQLELPTDRPRAPRQTGGAVHTFELEADLVDALRALGVEHGATLFMTLLAGYAALLHRYSGQDDFTIGCPISDRQRAETANLIGLFLNVLVMRIDCSGDPTFATLLGRVRDTALAAYGNQDMPFEMLVEELSPDRDLARNPLYQADFQLHPRFTNAESLEFPGLTATDERDASTDGAVVDLSLYLAEWDGRVRGYLRYKTDLFDAVTVERLAGHFVGLLRGVVGDPDAVLSGLSLVSAEERRLLAEWNSTEVVMPSGCVHELFEGVVARSPDAV